MAYTLTMPRQGNTVESCILVHWRVAEGARVGADDVVCEVETDKACFEVSAGASGILLKILKPEGEDVPVLEPIAVIGESGEDWSGALANRAPAPVEAAAPVPEPSAHAVASAPVPTVERTRAVSPRARRLAREQALEPAGLEGTGPGGRIIERDVRAALAGRPPLTAAARAAVASGAQDPDAGTALGGRVGISDLAAAGPGGAWTRTATGAGFAETPLRSIRKIIAERMRASLANTAQITLHGSAPAARIVALRARFKGGAPALGLSEVTIGDLVMYAVSRVVSRFPVINSHLVGSILRTFERVHLGFAVDTPRGLLVPVIRNADLLSLTELSAEARRLATACQGGTIAPDELSGATFTVSNLGALGVESFTPVLNAPEVGVLGVCAIVPRVAAGPHGELVLEPRMGLSLTVDHQIVDGAPAARILEAFSNAIGDIDVVWTK